MKSMTGFGRASATFADGTEASVLVRGVNHRFLDLSLKVRDEWASVEGQIRRAVSEVVSRGHVDVLVRTVRPVGRTATFDEDAAARYVALWREAAIRAELPGDLGARDLLGLPGVVRTEEAGDVDEASAKALLDTVRNALHEFDAARLREAEGLGIVLGAIVGRLEEGIARLDAERAGLSERLLKLLTERVAKLLAQNPMDDARMAQEVALLADRADISEEIDRFRTHLIEIKRLLASQGPIGKKLDFLSQELHREVNTAGQKVREVGATQAVLELKSQVEAFKEQVQNLE
jgi:uncharacterized protein (TIGR00255 family)